MKSWLTNTLIEEVKEGITSETYHHWPGTTSTSCCLVFMDSITEVATSDTEDPCRFNVQLGKEAAKAKAFNQLVDTMAKLRKLERRMDQSERFLSSLAVAQTEVK